METWRSLDAVWLLSLSDASLFQCHPPGYKVLTGTDHDVSLIIFQSVGKCFLANINANPKIKARSKYMGSKPWGRTSLE